MGRTKRKRLSKLLKNLSISLDSDPSVIRLKKWMKLHKSCNPHSLKLKTFALTGRGLASHKSVSSNEVLIKIPYHFMITSTTLDHSFLSDVILKDRLRYLMHQDVLSIFLVLEHHKGSGSEWKWYIDSLPTDIPLLPWISSKEEIGLVLTEIQTHLQKRVRLFDLSWKRSLKSIDSNWKCQCCGCDAKNLITYDRFLWAYVMVNTRSVYVDPETVKKTCSSGRFTNGLSDEPSMALCPYLDMFNHSNGVETCAKLVEENEQLIYQLTTLTAFQKHQQIFISYGDHDNMKLLCDYGFYIPSDELDSVVFSFYEVLKVFGAVDQRQYKFVQKRNLDFQLHVTVNGLSFNLKAVLFVITNPELLDWCSHVYSENYSEQCLSIMLQMAKRLVEFKTAELSRWVSECHERNLAELSAPFKNLLGYLDYKLVFMKKLMDTVHT